MQSDSITTLEVANLTGNRIAEGLASKEELQTNEFRRFDLLVNGKYVIYNYTDHFDAK